jgi:hypothetical protein
MKNSRKSQMQISETIFAVMIILIIIILALVFYAKAKESSLKEQAREARIGRVISLAHTLSSWAELECSIRETREFDCVDVIKLGLLYDFINRSKSSNGYAFNYYYDYLTRSKITITQVYPDAQSWTIYNNSGTTKTTDSVTVPVSLYDPVNRRYALGLMELRVYE